MVSFSTQISDCDSDSPALSFSSDASICYIMAYHLLGNSDQVVGSVSIDFLSNSKGNALFHHELITILVFIGIDELMYIYIYIYIYIHV